MPVVRLSIAVPPRVREWIEFREMLAHTARKMHFDAFADDATNRHELLMIAKTFADLALSIVPLAPENPSNDLEDTSCTFPADDRPLRIES